MLPTHVVNLLPVAHRHSVSVIALSKVANDLLHRESVVRSTQVLTLAYHGVDRKPNPDAQLLEQVMQVRLV